MRLAIDRPKKVELIQERKIECSLNHNKGDVLYRNLFGKKYYAEDDSWDFHMPWMHDTVIDYGGKYKRVGNELFKKHCVKLIYDENLCDEIWFDSGDEAKELFERIMEKFDLFEVDKGM